MSSYGTKRGIKAPGEYGISDIFGLGLAGAAGIVAALVTDYQQKGEASALYTINQWVVTAGNILGFSNLPLWVVVVGLIGIGAGSVFYFQPITRQGAFAQGFGLLAVLMTTVPADLADGLESTGAALPDLEPVVLEREASLEDGIMTANFSAAPADANARVIAVQDRQAARYVVELRIDFPNGAPDDIDQKISKGALRGLEDGRPDGHRRLGNPSALVFSPFAAAPQGRVDQTSDEFLARNSWSGPVAKL
mgnify:CR=1 FL=1